MEEAKQGEMSFLESAEETVESEHVHAVYSRIASHFSDTRYKPWPKVAEFIQRLQPGSLVADVGIINTISVNCRLRNLLTFIN